MYLLALLLVAQAVDPAPFPSRESVGLASEYGPFFFALLFLGGMAWTYKIYRGVCTRKEPPASRSELATCQRVFVGSWIAGLILVALCVVWWWFYRPTLYVFTGEIQGLKDYEKIVSTELFLKRVQIPTLSSNLPGLRDEQFVAVKTTPFEANDTFRVWFSKGPENQEELSLGYSPGRPRLKIEWNAEQNRNVLAPAKVARAAFPGLAVLEAASQAKVPQTKPTGPLVMAGLVPTVNPYLVEQLQSERTQVGAKIEALDKLLALDGTSLDAYMIHATAKEPVAVTLLDLSRHTDPELAFKARKVLDKASLDQLLTRQLTAADPRARDVATQTLLRMEPARAMQIAESAGPANVAEVASVKKQIAGRRGMQAPIPTGSPGGDRYYVRVGWPTDNATVGRCVADALTATPPVDPMGLRPDGLPAATEFELFWYSKDAAMTTSEQLRRCGARTEFVSPALTRRRDQ